MFHSRLSQTNSRLSHRMCTVLASLVLVCIYPSANMPTAQATTTTNITSTAIDQKTVPTTKDGLPTYHPQPLGLSFLPAPHPGHHDSWNVLTAIEPN